MTPEAEHSMYNRKNIIARINKMEIFTKGAEGMSEEQTIVFRKLIKGRLEALATSLSQESRKGPFTAADDQRDAYQKEFNCKVHFSIGIGKLFVDNVSNN